MAFKVIAINGSKVIRIVYGVRKNDKNIDTEFLIFDNGWMWMDADLYKPLIKKREV